MMATLTTCPECGHDNGVNLADDNRLCFDCRHEWNPADVDWQAVSLLQKLSADAPSDAMETMALGTEALTGTVIPERLPPSEPTDIDPTTEWETIKERLETQLVGREITWNKGDMGGTVYAINDDGEAEIHGADGIDYTLDANELDPILDAPELVDMDAETVAALGSAQLVMAGLALSAGLRTVAPEGARNPLLPPPSGWLPNDKDSIPIIESGVAYAVAMLIYFFQLDKGQLQELVDSWAPGNI